MTFATPVRHECGFTEGPLLLAVLLVGLGGFLGSARRHIVSNAASKIFGTRFPLGTLTVNAIGCFLMGFFMELAMEYQLIPSEIRLFLTTGFIGGFTTFSTFGYETVSMALGKNGLQAFFHVILHLCIGISMVWAGRLLAHRWN